jgi:hypothetical protein
VLISRPPSLLASIKVYFIYIYIYIASVVIPSRFTSLTEKTN